MGKVTEFLEKVSADNSTAEEMNRILDGPEDLEKRLLLIRSLAERMGFDISLEDLKEYESGELAEEKLEDVAGGISFLPGWMKREAYKR